MRAKEEYTLTSYIVRLGRMLTAIVVICMVAACSPLFTSKTSREEQGKEITSSKGYSKEGFIRAYSQHTFPSVIDARGGLTIKAPNINQSVNIKWTYIEKEAFILSARALGLLEVARCVVTPNKVIVLDRMNKRAMVINDVKEILEKILPDEDINQDVLKSFVTQEPFTLKRSGVAVLKEMKMIRKEESYIFSQKKGDREIIHTFDNNLNLVESQILIKGVDVLHIDRSNFVAITPESRPYPTEIAMKAIAQRDKTHSSKEYSIEINLDKPTIIPSQDANLKVPKSYKVVSQEELFKIFTKN